MESLCLVSGKMTCLVCFFLSSLPPVHPRTQPFFVLFCDLTSKSPVQSGGKHLLDFSFAANFQLFIGLPFWIAKWPSNSHFMPGALSLVGATTVRSYLLTSPISSFRTLQPGSVSCSVFCSLMNHPHRPQLPLTSPWEIGNSAPWHIHLEENYPLFFESVQFQIPKICFSIKEFPKPDKWASL